MENTFLIVLQPARASFPADATPEERETVGAHFEFLKTHMQQNNVFFFGRTDEQKPMGLILVTSDKKEVAEDIVAHDPAVRAGLMIADLRPFRLMR